MHSSLNYCNASRSFHLLGDFSSDAQFFVATGVLSVLYCIGIILVYVMLDAMYQSTGLLPLAVRFNYSNENLWLIMVNVVCVCVCVCVYRCIII
jgi:hypothetical protein